MSDNARYAAFLWTAIVIGAGFLLALFAMEPNCPASAQSELTRLHGWQCVVVVDPVEK